MKKILLCLIFSTFGILSAQTPKNESYTVDDLLHEGLEQLSLPRLGGTQGIVTSKISKAKMKQFINSNLIIERSGEFSNITSFNSGINIANANYFKQALIDIHLASNKKTHINNTDLERFIKDDKAHKNIVNVAILNTEYNKINYDKEDPLNPNKGYYLINNALIPIENRQHFIPLHATVISPLKKEVVGDQIIYKFSKDLLFTNGLKIQNLDVDLGDGVHRNIIKDQHLIINKVTIPNTSSKNIKQTYYITYSDGKQKTTYSVLYARSISNPPSIKLNRNYLRSNFTHISKYPFQGYLEKKAYRGQIDCRIFYAKNNIQKKLLKPIFILEGFDPGDKRKIENIDYLNPNDTLSSPPLFDKMIYDGDKNLIKTLNNKNYDVIICNFPIHKKQDKTINGGADYVERNSLAFVSLLQEINKELQNNYSKEQLVILGPSMGAIISRYALAYMEKKQAETNNQIWNHNTRLWVSMDGPHLGANIPIGIQSVLYLAGYIGKSAGAKRSYDYTLKSVTAQQFLINQHKEGAESYHFIDDTYMDGQIKEQGYSNNSGSPFYQQFYRTLYTNGLPNSKGFPLNTRKIAIINGTIKGTKIGDSSQKTLYMKGYVKLCALWGSFCSKMHVTTLGTWNMPNLGETKVIAKFKKAFETKTTQATNYGVRGNFDILSGGFSDTFNQISRQTSDSTDNSWGIFDRLTMGVSKLLNGELNNFNVYTNVKKHGFIPAVSALAINSPEINWGSDLTSEVLNDIGELTPFDNYFIPQKNEEHVELTKANVEWLLQEIDGKKGEQTWLKSIKSIDTYKNNFRKNITVFTTNSNLLNSKLDINNSQTELKELSPYNKETSLSVMKYQINDEILAHKYIPSIVTSNNSAIYIKSFKDIDSIKIFNTKGTVFYNRKNLTQEKIDVSYLENNIYYLTVNTKSGASIKYKLLIMV